MTVRVMEIHTYPVKGEPGTDLDECPAGPEGLDGDRRKKAPLHLVATCDGATTRANLVIATSPEELGALVGHRVGVGEIVLSVSGRAGTCAGVYADVVRPGTVHLGDVVGPVDTAG